MGPLRLCAKNIKIGVSGKTYGHRLAVVADEKPTPATPLYEFPFSNVYEGGGICTGAANSLPAYKNLRTLSSLPDFILSFPNNDHMFLSSRNKLKLGYRDLLEHLKDKEPSYYYSHVLIPRKRSKAATLQDFIDNNLGGQV